MTVKILTLAFDAALEGFDNEVLAAFLAGKTVHRLHSEFFQQQGKAYWTLLIEYDLTVVPTENKKPDLRLTPTQQQLLNDLQEWRREKAAADGVPVYVIATNKELQALVVKHPLTLDALQNIAGFGKKKCQRHGQDILVILQRYHNVPSPGEEEAVSATEKAAPPI